MKTNIVLRSFIALFVILSTMGCKENSAKENPSEVKITSQTNTDDAEAMPELDPSLDPLIVGKEYSKVFSDTLNVQMYEFTMKPGDSVGLHQHLDHSVYVLEGGKLMVYINGTDPVEMELKTGVGFVGGPLTDTAVNIGETTVKLLISEIHRPRVK